MERAALSYSFEVANARRSLRVCKCRCIATNNIIIRPHANLMKAWTSNLVGWRWQSVINFLQELLPVQWVIISYWDEQKFTFHKTHP
jgi:hypothetical protein